MKKYCYKVFIFVLICCFISCNNDDNEDFYPENQVIYKDQFYNIENIQFIDSYTRPSQAYFLDDDGNYTEVTIYPQSLEFDLISEKDTLELSFFRFLKYPLNDLYYLGPQTDIGPNGYIYSLLYGTVDKNSVLESNVINGELKVIKTEPFFEIKFKGEIERITRGGINNEGEIRGHYKGNIDFPEEWLED